MIRDTRPDTAPHEGRVKEIMLTAWFCDDCDEAILTCDEAQVIEDGFLELEGAKD